MTTISSEKLTQGERLLALLEAHEGEWLPLFKILQLGIAQYNARIHELRKQGYTIENKTMEIVNGHRYTAFRYLGKQPKVHYGESLYG
jgi:hypothetical protein